MRIKKTAPLFFICLAMLIIFAVNASASGKVNLESREYDYGIAAGIWLPGTITIEDLDIDKSAGLLLRGFADVYVAPKLAVGAYGNYSMATLEKGPFEADARFWELGVALKAKFMLSPDLAMKPGLNIGYRSLSRDSVAGYDDPGDDLSADGLGLNLSVEFQFALEGGYIFFADVGFLSQPAGGTDDVDVTWAPIFYLCAGIAF